MDESRLNEMCLLVNQFNVSSANETVTSCTLVTDWLIIFCISYSTLSLCIAFVIKNAFLCRSVFPVFLLYNRVCWTDFKMHILCILFFFFAYQCINVCAIPPQRPLPLPLTAKGHIPSEKMLITNQPPSCICTMSPTASTQEKELQEADRVRGGGIQEIWCCFK